MNYNKIIQRSVFIVITSLLFYSCDKESELKKDFSCNDHSFQNLEVIKDVKGNFSVKFPSSWKTNLYTDEVQSSIYGADTTKQLTETFLLDVSFVSNSIEINPIFKLKIEQENLAKNLIKKKEKEIMFLNKPSYYVVSAGKKGKFEYQALQIFINLNEEKLILIKAEVYGDSLVNERLCKAITLIEKIKILQ